MELPDDPMMLFSMVNMKLRDCYSSLDELCDETGQNHNKNQIKDRCGEKRNQRIVRTALYQSCCFCNIDGSNIADDGGLFQQHDHLVDQRRKNIFKRLRNDNQTHGLCRI